MILRILLLLGLSWLGCQVHMVAAAPAQHGAAATVHPLATAAALEAMRSGGNAVDAALAAALTLGVVDSHNSGLGGGCFLLIRLPDGSFATIDGRETAPASATHDMFLREGKADLQLSQTGPLAIAVPGALAAYECAATNYARLPLRQHLERAAQLAEKGFAVGGALAGAMSETASDLRRFEASRAALLKADGSPWKAGEIWRQPDLAGTYRAVAENGTRWFYEGPFARATAAWMATNAGRITAHDFQDYEAKRREPIESFYRGCRIVGFPPPSSGGVHVAQILNILEHFEVKRMGQGSADLIHAITEAMKLAFADRAYWLGDPDFTRIPRGLAGREYAAALARGIRMDRASTVAQQGEPGWDAGAFGKHTTHFSTADSEGFWVACTATINTHFGSKVVIPGTGLVMNNEMDDFAAQPGVPNFFGLVGAEANAVGPRRRPLSSMSPTVVLRDGQPILAVGAAGGPTIISQTVLAIVNVVDFGMTPEQALARPRFHHQWKPDELRVEKSVPEKVRRELAARGHNVKVVNSLGAAQAVGWDARSKTFQAAADPRGEGQGRVW